MKTFLEEFETPEIPTVWTKEELIEALDYLEEDEIQEIGEEIAELIYDEDFDEFDEGCDGTGKGKGKGKFEDEDEDESLDEVKYFNKKANVIKREKKQDKSTKRKKAKERKKWYKQNKAKVKRKQKKHRRKVKVGSHRVTRHR